MTCLTRMTGTTGTNHCSGQADPPIAPEELSGVVPVNISFSSFKIIEKRLCELSLLHTHWRIHQYFTSTSPVLCHHVTSLPTSPSLHHLSLAKLGESDQHTLQHHRKKCRQLSEPLANLVEVNMLWFYRLSLNTYVSHTNYWTRC